MLLKVYKIVINFTKNLRDILIEKGGGKRKRRKIYDLIA
jgi:hypothetical protein